MTNNRKTPPKKLGELEQMVMEHIWSEGTATAEGCRLALAKAQRIRQMLTALKEHLGQLAPSR